MHLKSVVIFEENVSKVYAGLIADIFAANLFLELPTDRAAGVSLPRALNPAKKIERIHTKYPMSGLMINKANKYARTLPGDGTVHVISVSEGEEVDIFI